MKDWEGEPEGSRPGVWKLRFPSRLLRHPRILCSGSKFWLPALAALLDWLRPSQALALQGQQSRGKPQVGSQHWSPTHHLPYLSQVQVLLPIPQGQRVPAVGASAVASSEVLVESKGRGDRS